MSDAGSEAPDSIDYPDVREHMAELLASCEPSVDEVDWGRFRHGNGVADEVPDLLRALWDRDQERASGSLSALWSRVRHQGGSSAPAALAVPFLLRAAADPAVHNRAQLLQLAAEAGHRNHFGRDRREDLLQVEYLPDEEAYDPSGYPSHWILPAARAALAVGVPVLAGLLDDPDPEVRSHAAYALATAASPPPHVRDALRARLAVESEATVRISLVLAVAQLAAEQGGDPGIEAWTRQLWAGPDNPADVRLAGALAWLCVTRDRPPTALLDMLAALARAQEEQWLQETPWPDHIEYHGGLASWLVLFLGDEPDAQVRLTASLITQPDPVVVASACRAAHDLAWTWRSRTEEMLDLLAAQLDHPDCTVRLAAVRLLARSGAVPARVADRIATVLEDEDPEIPAQAAVALAHRGDVRAVAPLVELLTQAECPWPCDWTWSSRPPHRLIDMLGPHADAILPTVTYRLAQPGSRGWWHVRRDLLQGLVAWNGAEAAGAASALADLLAQSDDEQDQYAIVNVLGQVGTAAAVAVPVLDTLLAEETDDFLGVLAWARWRITGERAAQTAETLAQKDLRLLADLGPAAAAHAPMIRSMLASRGEGVRARAAHALWRCTGDTADTVPVLLQILDGIPWAPMFAPGHSVVVECLGEIGTPAAAAAPALTRYLEADQRRDCILPRHDPISWDQHGQSLAAAALSRIRPSDPGTQTLPPRLDES